MIWRYFFLSSHFTHKHQDLFIQRMRDPHFLRCSFFDIKHSSTTIRANTSVIGRNTMINVKSEILSQEGEHHNSISDAVIVCQLIYIPMKPSPSPVQFSVWENRNTRINFSFCEIGLLWSKSVHLFWNEPFLLLEDYICFWDV